MNKYDTWLALDTKRAQSEGFILLDNGSSLKPAFTCTDNKKAYKVLKKLMKERNQWHGHIQKHIPNIEWDV